MYVKCRYFVMLMKIIKIKDLQFLVYKLIKNKIVVTNKQAK